MNLTKKIPETNIEKIVREALQKRNIKFIEQYPMKVGFIGDFFLPDYNIIIEADGERWHTDKKRERFRDYMISRIGIKVVHFKGDDIINDVEKCFNDIHLV